MADDSIKLTIEAILNDKEFQAGLKRMSNSGETQSKKTSAAFDGLKNTFKNIQQNILAIGTAFYAAGKAIGSVISSFVEADQAQRQLEARLKSTGNAVGLTSDELIKLSTELQNVTTFGDETVLTAENMLLTFTKIGGDVFPKATEAVLDMATALGGDVASNAKLLGKALNDPTEGLTALRRAGVQMTDAQEAQIKTLWDMGDAAGAQAIVLDTLSQKIGGSARAAAEGSGQIKQFENKIDDLKEEIGGKLMPVVVDFLKGLDSLPKGLKLTVVGAGALIPVIGALTMAFGPWGIAIGLAAAGLIKLISLRGQWERSSKNVNYIDPEKAALYVKNTQDMITYGNEQIKKQDEQINKFKEYKKSLEESGDAHTGLIFKTDEYKKALKFLNDAEKERASLVATVKDREKDLADAREKFGDAAFKQAETTKKSQSIQEKNIKLTDDQKNSILSLKDEVGKTDEAQLKYFERLKKDGVKSGELYGASLKLVDDKILALTKSLEDAGKSVGKYTLLTEDQIEVLKDLEKEAPKSPEALREKYVELLAVVGLAPETFKRVQQALVDLDMEAHNEQVKESIANWQGLEGVFSAIGGDEGALGAAIAKQAELVIQSDLLTASARTQADAADRLANSWAQVAGVIGIVRAAMTLLSNEMKITGEILTKENEPGSGAYKLGVWLQDTSKLIDALNTGGIPGLIRAIHDLYEEISNVPGEAEKRGIAGSESERGTQSQSEYMANQKKKAQIATVAAGTVLGGGAGAAIAAGVSYSATRGYHRAKGGDVRAGQSYVVGEEGPEPFVPYVNGRIYPTEFMNAFRGIPTQSNSGMSTNDNRRYETIENRNNINMQVNRMDDPIQFVNTLKRDYGIDVFGNSR